MKKIIVKAIVKATGTNRKTAHVPFYKGITTATPTTATPTTATPTTATPTTATPTTAKDLYTYILRYTVETHRAVMNFPLSWEDACKELYNDMCSFERFLYACNRDYWMYKLLYHYYAELNKNPYIRDNWNRYYLVSNLWDNAYKNMSKNAPFYGKFDF